MNSFAVVILYKASTYLLLSFSLYILALFFTKKFAGKKSERIEGVGRRQSSRVSYDSDVVIVGGGLAGCILAMQLAKQKKKVIVVERCMQTKERLVGEFLQPGGVEELKKMKLYDDIFSEIDHKVKKGFVRIMGPMNHVMPFEGENGVTYQYHNLVERVRSITQKEENVTFVEGTATNFVLQENQNVIGVKVLSINDVNDPAQREILAPLTVVCDGLFSKFRNKLGLKDAKISGYFIAILLEDCEEFKENFFEFIPTSNGPVMVYKLDTNKSRILIGVKDDPSKNGKASVSEGILPELPSRLHQPLLNALSYCESVPFMPTFSYSASASPLSGVVSVGDSTNIRSPITGSGISVLLKDIRILADKLSTISDLRECPERLGKSIAEFYSERVASHAFSINVMAYAYSTLSFSKRAMHIMSRGYLSGFQLSKRNTSDLVQIISCSKSSLSFFFRHVLNASLESSLFIAKKNTFNIFRTVFDIFDLFYACSKALLPIMWSEFKTFSIRHAI